MHAETLRRFFEGTAEATELAHDLPGSWVQGTNGSQYFQWTDLTEVFSVEPHHLVQVCDAVLRDQLATELVQVIGSCLAASIHWQWPEGEEGERLLHVVDWWDTPEINYKLTPATIDKMRHWILTGADTFTPDDFYYRPGAQPA